MKKLLSLLGLTFFLLFNAGGLKAQYEQPPTYSIVIDKMVSYPSSQKTANNQSYVDNLSPTDPRFSPGQDLWFKIKVKNTSDENLTAVEVKDYVPNYLLPIEGPGKWYLENRTIVWNAGDFAVNEEKVYYIKMRVYEQNLLPADKGLFCLINKASAQNNVVYDEDTAQLCIEKQVKAVTTVPSAGPEMGLALTSLNLFGLSLGFFLKKKAKDL